MYILNLHKHACMHKHAHMRKHTGPRTLYASTYTTVFEHIHARERV